MNFFGVYTGTEDKDSVFMELNFGCFEYGFWGLNLLRSMEVLLRRAALNGVWFGVWFDIKRKIWRGLTACMYVLELWRIPDGV